MQILSKTFAFRDPGSKPQVTPMTYSLPPQPNSTEPGASLAKTMRHAATERRAATAESFAVPQIRHVAVTHVVIIAQRHAVPIPCMEECAASRRRHSAAALMRHWVCHPAAARDGMCAAMIKRPLGAAIQMHCRRRRRRDPPTRPTASSSNQLGSDRRYSWPPPLT